MRARLRQPQVPAARLGLQGGQSLAGFEQGVRASAPRRHFARRQRRDAARLPDLRPSGLLLCAIPRRFRQKLFGLFSLASRARDIFARRIGGGHTRGVGQQRVGAAIGLGGESFEFFGFFRP